MLHPAKCAACCDISRECIGTGVCIRPIIFPFFLRGAMLAVSARRCAFVRDIIQEMEKL